MYLLLSGSASKRTLYLAAGGRENFSSQGQMLPSEGVGLNFVIVLLKKIFGELFCLLGRAIYTGRESSIGGTSALDWRTERSFEALEEEESWALKSRAERTLGSGERKFIERESMGFRVKIETGCCNWIT